MLIHLIVLVFFLQLSHGAPVGKRSFKDTLWNSKLPSVFKDDLSRAYTGFNFYKKYYFKLLPFQVSSSMITSFTYQGRKQWEIVQPFQEDIDWEMPFCVYENSNLTAVQVMKKTKYLAMQDPDNFHCFKMARRKKYMNRQVSIYLPWTWVGGLFFCKMTNMDKLQVLGMMNNHLVFYNNVGKSNMTSQSTGSFCTRENAVPLLPLIADDYSKNHANEIELDPNKSILGKLKDLSFSKVIPYVYTPNIKRAQDFTYTSESVSIDPELRKFQYYLNGLTSINSDLKPKEHWYSQLEVQENYQLSEEDYSQVGKMIDKTMDKIDSISNFPTSNNILFSQGTRTALKQHGIRRTILNRLESLFWKFISVRDRSLTIINTHDEEFDAIKADWENLSMESVDYEYPLLS